MKRGCLISLGVLLLLPVLVYGCVHYNTPSVTVRLRLIIEAENGTALGSGVVEVIRGRRLTPPPFFFAMFGQAVEFQVPNDPTQYFALLEGKNTFSGMPEASTFTNFDRIFHRAGFTLKELVGNRPQVDWKHFTYFDEELARWDVLNKLQGKRAELMPEDFPFTVFFNDPADPSTVQEAIIPGTEPKSPYASAKSWELTGRRLPKLRMFWAPTTDPISVGIERKLPWITTLRSQHSRYVALNGSEATGVAVNKIQPLYTELRLNWFLSQR